MSVLFAFWLLYLRNFRAHIARWCAENNRPHKIVKDNHFEIIMKAGWLGTSLPSPMTVSQDIKAAFKISCEFIDNILKVSLWICFEDSSFKFSICIGSLWASTFCNGRMDFPKSPGLHRLDSTFTAPWKNLGIFTRYHWGAKGNVPARILFSMKLIV